MSNIPAQIQSALEKQSKGDVDDAIDIYRCILQMQPTSIEALCNLGSILHAKGLLSEAITCYRDAIAVDPNIPQLYYNIAGAQLVLDQVVAARKNLAQAIVLKPDYLDALFRLGMLDIQCGNHEIALTYLKQLLSLAPSNADALNGIGVCMKELGESKKALNYFQQASHFNPNHFQAHANLAVELLSRDAIDESIRISEHALALNPGDPKLLYNLGIAHEQKKCFAEAISYFRQALVADPGAVYAKLSLAYVLQSVCDWTDTTYSLHATARFVQDILDTAADGTIDSFRVLSLPFEPNTLLRIAARKSENLSRKTADFHNTFDHAHYRKTSRLRVAYLSPDYCNHPAMQLFGGMFQAHNRDNIEIFAYSIGLDDASIYRRRVETEAEHFVDLYDKSIKQCIERIRADRIHVLVDLTGYTSRARPEILAARSAPVQVNYLGFPGTLGADFVDYIITDPIISPPNHQAFYSEEFAYLPHCYQINDDRDKADKKLLPRSKYGLPEDAFVFCCFNNNYKIDSLIFRTWMKILTKVPGSVLWLLKGSDLQMENLRREASSFEVDPERIVFAEPVEKAIHLARHSYADLFLDTLYYNAHTTGSDALKQGVPMITCQGKTFSSRVGSSLIHAVGLDELVTTNLNQYIDKAVQLGTDGKKMSDIRSKLSRNLPRSSLLDNPRFARNLESLYQIMWQRFADGEDTRQISPGDTQQTIPDNP